MMVMTVTLDWVWLRPAVRKGKLQFGIWQLLALLHWYGGTSRRINVACHCQIGTCIDKNAELICPEPAPRVFAKLWKTFPARHRAITRVHGFSAVARRSATCDKPSSKNSQLIGSFFLDFCRSSRGLSLQTL